MHLHNIFIHGSTRPCSRRSAHWQGSPDPTPAHWHWSLFIVLDFFQFVSPRALFSSFVKVSGGWGTPDPDQISFLVPLVRVLGGASGIGGEHSERLSRGVCHWAGRVAFGESAHLRLALTLAWG
jgi:hypothetical protein